MKYKMNRGFTLVELMLAMTFLSVLLVMIAMLTLQVSTIYSKGLSLRAVNEAGQLLSRELQQNLNTSSSSTNSPPVQKPEGGRLCVNGSVYAWLYGDNVRIDNSLTLLNEFPDADLQIADKRDIRFIKFTGGNDYCEIDPVDNSYRALPGRSDTTELLGAGNANLVLRNFELTQSSPVAGDSTQTLYHVKLTLGTKTTDLIYSSDCVSPQGGDDEFCAVNEFSFTARAGRNK